MVVVVVDECSVTLEDVDGGGGGAGSEERKRRLRSDQPRNESLGDEGAEMVTLEEGEDGGGGA